MDMHLHSHHWVRRAPDWTAAAGAGFVAGAVLMVLDLLWSAATGTSPWITSRRIAAIVMGPDVLQSTAFSLWIVASALVTHYLLGIVFGMIMGAIIAPFHFDSSQGLALLVGAALGLVLYLLNFHGMVAFFPWFAEMRGWPTLVAHLIFGLVTALMYHAWHRPDGR